MSDHTGLLSNEGKLLRAGYTTGSCATAAAKAAVMSLVSNELNDFSSETTIAILTPEAKELNIPLHTLSSTSPKHATASVIKDAGDDYDVTHGIEIFADVILIEKSADCIIKGGEGVGVITKPGLQRPVGEAAINPKPLEMIKSNIMPLLPEGYGVEIVIRVPQGATVAKKTFNERLGIIGGISIIGTSGVVRPMSEDAFKASIYAELKQKRHLGVTPLILVPGKHGELYCENTLNYPAENTVHMSNFVGFALQSASNLGFEEILIVGHVGKLIKLAGGIFNTHSKVADAKAEILCTHLALRGAPIELVEIIYAANTTDEMSEILYNTPYWSVFQKITEIAKDKCVQLLHETIKLNVVIYDMKNRLLGETHD